MTSINLLQHTMSSSKITAEVATPLKRLAAASTTTCATQAAAYGKCVLATYMDVKKDICKTEFEAFGKCLRETVRVLHYSAFVY